MKTARCPAPENVSAPEGLPLTSMQRGMLVESLRDPRANLEQVVLHCEENLDVNRLRLALEHFVERETILRSYIANTGSGDPLWMVREEGVIDWRVLEREVNSPEEREKVWDQFLEEDRAEGVSWEVPWRASCIRWAENSWTLCLSITHILVDGRSMVPIVREIFTAYGALGSGEDYAPTPRTDFRDYLNWLQSQDWSEAEDFWTDLFESYETAPEVVVRETELLTLTGRREEALTISSDRLQKWRASSGPETLSTLIEGAWGIVLAKYMGRSDAVYNTIRSGRYWGSETPGEDMGMFINHLPMRIELKSEQSARQFLDETRKLQLRYRRFEHTPHHLLSQWVGAENLRPASYLMFEGNSWARRIHTLGAEWKNRRMEIYARTVADLFLVVFTDEEGLYLTLEYNRSQYSAEAICGMLEQLAHVVDQLVEFPEQSIGQIGLLDAEAEQVILASEDRAVPSEMGELPVSLGEAFARVVAKHADRVAISHHDQSLTYKELDTLSGRIAQALSLHGVLRGDRVAIFQTKSLEMAASLLGVIKVGAAYVPIDPQYPRERIEHMVRESAAKLLLVPPGEAVEVAGCPSLWIAPADLPSEVLSPVGVESQTPSYVVFTSGSTGLPKGSENTHRGLLNEVQAFHWGYQFQPGERMGQLASVGFDSAIEEFWATWLGGGHLVLMPPEKLNSLESLCSWLDAEEIAIQFLPTSLWNALVDSLEKSQVKLPHALRIVIVGGEAAHRAVYRRWKALVGDRVGWANTYGPSEAAVVSTWFRDWVDALPTKDDLMPIGVSLPRVRHYVVDASGHLVPPGVVGELWVAGAGVAHGYVGRPLLTEGKFCADGFFPETGERLYKTGDLAWRDRAGQFYFIGRTDRQVQVRGFRVEPGEIENQISACEGVQEAAVKIFTEPQPVIVAYVVASDGGECSEDRLHLALRARLPHYMIPNRTVFVDALAKTEHGKIDYEVLESPLGEVVLSGVEKEDGPRSGIEQILLDAWKSVLGLNRVHLHDNFFSLGGDSLRAMELVQRVAKAGLKMDVEDVVLFPTIASLGDSLESQYVSADGEEFSPVIALRAEGSKPPLWLVHPTPGDVIGYGNLVYHLGAEQPCYGIRARGLHDESLAHESLEEMASYYVEHLLASGISAPYYLGGWCYGGVVALEMAQQLRRQGHAIGALILIDAWAPPIEGKQWLQKWQRLQCLLSSGPVGVGGFLQNKISGWLHRRANRGIFGDQEELHLRRRHSKVYQDNMRIYYRYRVQSYPDKIHLILAPEYGRAIIADPMAGWNLVTASIEKHTISCRHEQILHEPAARELAEIIQGIIPERC